MKILTFMVVLATLLLSGCVKTNDELSQSCIDNSGNWLPEYNECENVSTDWCVEKTGEYNECESSCRHESVDICVMMCVPVCKF